MAFPDVADAIEAQRLGAELVGRRPQPLERRSALESALAPKASAGRFMIEGVTETATKGKPAGKRRERVPLEVRAKALELYAEHGPSKASRLLAEEGIEVKPDTLSQWGRRSGIPTRVKANTTAATDARMASWKDNRARVVEQWADVALQTLQQAKTAQSAGELRNLLTAAGIATDKCRALENETAGPDDLIAIDTEIQALLAQLDGGAHTVVFVRELLREGWRPPLGWTPTSRNAAGGIRSHVEQELWEELREDLAQWAREHDGFDELLGWAEGAPGGGPARRRARPQKETVSQAEPSRIDAEIEHLLGRMEELDTEKAQLTAKADELEGQDAQMVDISPAS